MLLLDIHNNTHDIQDKDIFCIRSIKRDIYYYTKEGIYKRPRTLEDHLLIYGPMNYARIDKNRIVNLALIDKLHFGKIHYLGVVYKVSRDRIKKVIEMLEDMNN